MEKDAIEKLVGNPHEEEAPKTLALVDLSALHWSKGLPERKGYEVYESRKQIEMNGVRFELEATQVAYDSAKNGRWVDFYFIIRDVQSREACVEGRVLFTFHASEDEWSIGTLIKKISDNEAARGAGVLLYERMLDFIEKNPVTKGRDSEHKVERVLSSAHLVTYQLSPEAWNKIFEPILERWGYEKVRDGFWRKRFNKDGAVRRADLVS